MNSWTFFDFLDSRKNNLIREWLDSLPAKASAKIDARVLYMQAVPVWPEQYVSALKGWPELFELRVASAGAQYRPLCCYGPNRRQVTILLGAIEKGKLPQRVLENADANRKIVFADNSRIVEHVFRRSAAGGISSTPSEFQGQ